MTEVVFIRDLDRTTYLALRDKNLTGLVFTQVEFNQDTQKYDMAIRHATIKDI